MLGSIDWRTNVSDNARDRRRHALTVLTNVANAQPSPQWRTCTGNPGIEWDTQIESCTALIQSGKETKERLVAAYNNRAIQDYGPWIFSSFLVTDRSASNTRARTNIFAKL